MDLPVKTALSSEGLHVAPRPLSLPKLLPATSQPLQSPFHSANIQPTVANGKQSTEEHQVLRPPAKYCACSARLVKDKIRVLTFPCVYKHRTICRSKEILKSRLSQWLLIPRGGVPLSSRVPSMSLMLHPALMLPVSDPRPIARSQCFTGLKHACIHPMERKWFSRFPYIGSQVSCLVSIDSAVICDLEELEKAVRAFLARESQSAEENGATEERMLSDSNNEHEEEGQMLKHLRRLSTVLLNGHAAAVMHLLPLEYHLQLLKALSGYILQGRDKVLHPVEEARSCLALSLCVPRHACIHALEFSLFI